MPRRIHQVGPTSALRRRCSFVSPCAGCQHFDCFPCVILDHTTPATVSLFSQKGQSPSSVNGDPTSHDMTYKPMESGIGRRKANEHWDAALALLPKSSEYLLGLSRESIGSMRGARFSYLQPLPHGEHTNLGLFPQEKGIPTSRRDIGMQTLISTGSKRASSISAVRYALAISCPHRPPMRGIKFWQLAVRVTICEITVLLGTLTLTVRSSKFSFTINSPFSYIPRTANR